MKITKLCFSIILLFAAALTAFSEDKVPVYRSGEKIMVLPVPVSTDMDQSVVYTTVHFRFDKSVLDVNYRGNDEVLTSLHAVIDSIGIDNIISVEVVSQSSPEGGYPHNIELSKQRAKAMGEYLGSEYPELKSRLTVNPAGESWQQLKMYVRMDKVLSEKTKQRIYSVIDAEGISVDTRKWRMENRLGEDYYIPHKDKSVYRYLRRTYYPLIRNSAIYIGFKGGSVLYVGPEMETPERVDSLYHPQEPVVEPAVQEEEPAVQEEESVEQEEELAVQEEEPAEQQVQPTMERVHMLAVRTNLVRDLLVLPKFGFAPSADLQFEYYPLNGHYTANAGFTWSNHRHYDAHQFFQVRDLQLELRRYFRGNADYTGPYVGAYGQGTIYGIALTPGKGAVGEGWGAGLDLGWVLPLNRKGNFRMEFNLALGYFGSVYDPFVFGNPVTGDTSDGKYYYDYVGPARDFTRRNYLFTWFGPANVGISLTYDILYRRYKTATKEIKHDEESAE